jgi:hypothetical protein
VVLGKEHANTLASFNALAWNLRGQERYEEALSMMQIAAEGRKHALGADHPHYKLSCEWHTEWLAEMQERKGEVLCGKKSTNRRSLCLREREGGALKGGRRISKRLRR